jgi:hypothetical protein
MGCTLGDGASIIDPISWKRLSPDVKAAQKKAHLWAGFKLCCYEQLVLGGLYLTACT